MLWELSIVMRELIRALVAENHRAMISLGFVRKPSTYGSVIFTEDGWVKRRESAAPK